MVTYWRELGALHLDHDIYSQLAAMRNLVLGGHVEHVSQCGLRALRFACTAEQLDLVRCLICGSLVVAVSFLSIDTKG